MKKTICMLLLIASVFCAGAACAADWQTIGKAQNGNEYFIDKADIVTDHSKKLGDTITLSIKVVYPKETAEKISANYKAPVEYLVERWTAQPQKNMYKVVSRAVMGPKKAVDKKKIKEDFKEYKANGLVDVVVKIAAKMAKAAAQTAPAAE